MNPKKLVFYIILFYVSYLSFPIAKDILQIPTAFLDFFVLGSVLIFRTKAMYNKATLWAAIYLFILAIYVFIGKGLPNLGIADYDGSRLLVIESAKILTAIAIFSFWYKERDTLPWGSFMTFTLVLFAISFIYILPSAQMNVDLMRKNEAHGINHTFGIPNYTLTHAYMFLVPTLLYGIKVYKSKIRWALIAILLLLLITILKSYVSTTIILSFVAIVMTLFYKDETRKLIASSSIIFTVVLLLYATGIIDSMLDYLVDIFTGTASESKMIEMRAMLTGVEIDDNGVFQTRSDLHQMSWNAFKNNILFGSKGCGGHSYIIDRLGGLGLFGTIPFLIMLYNSFKIMFKTFCTKKSKFYFFITVSMVFAMMYTKGLFGEEAWMMMWGITPIYLYVIQNKELNNK